MRSWNALLPACGKFHQEDVVVPGEPYRKRGRLEDDVGRLQAVWRKRHGVIVEPIGSEVASGGNPGDSGANSWCEPPDAVDVLRGLAKLAQRHERATGDDHVDRMLGVQLR